MHADNRALPSCTLSLTAIAIMVKAMNYVCLSFSFTSFIYLCEVLTPTNAISPNVDTVPENEWPACLVTIAKNHFVGGSSVAIVGGNLSSVGFAADMSDWIVQQMMWESQWSIVLKTIDGRKSQREKRIDHYILFINSKRDCVRILHMLVESSSWNSGARFLIHIYHSEEHWHDLILFIFDKFWIYFVVNLAINVSTQYNVSTTEIFTSMPFDADSLGNIPHKLTTATCAGARLVPHDVNIFPEKVPTDLNQFPIKIIARYAPPFVLPPKSGNLTYWLTSGSDDVPLIDGTDVKLIRTIAEKLNFRPMMRLVGYEFQGILFELRKGQNASEFSDERFRSFASMAIGITWPLKNQMGYAFSTAYSQVEYTILLSNDHAEPYWNGMIKVLQPYVWYATLAACATFSIVIWILLVVTVAEETWPDAGRICLIIIGFLVANSPSIPSRFYQMRFILLIWSLFCVCWITAYTSTLISMITTPIRIDTINSFSDVIANKMSLVLTKEGRNTLKSDLAVSEREQGELLTSLKICETVPICFDTVVENKNYATVGYRALFDYMASRYVNKDGIAQIRTSKTNHVSVPKGIIMLKGFALQKQLNFMLRRIVEAGLVQCWTDHVLTDKIGETSRKMQQNHNEHKPLQVEHIIGAFYVLGIGSVVGLCIFLIEVTWRIFKKRKRTFRNPID